MKKNKAIKIFVWILAYLIPVFALFIPHSHFDVAGNEAEQRALSETGKKALIPENRIEITDQFHSWGTLVITTKTDTGNLYYTVFDKCGFLDLYYNPINGDEIEARGDEVISVHTQMKMVF